MRTLLSFSTKAKKHSSSKANVPQRIGQMTVAGMGVLALTIVSGCDAHKPVKGVIGYVDGWAGVVSAEEPRAALVGENILTAGGTAADAAVAMAATLTVTLPSRAGWAGGGVCISQLPTEAKDVKVFAFMPEPLPGGGYAPGMPRGLYAMHAASGVLRWETVLTQAENLARFGAPVSRALAKDLAQVDVTTSLTGEARAPFMHSSGRLLREGEQLVQLRASTTLSTLRTKSVGEVYAGSIANLIAQADPTLEQERKSELRTYRAQKLAPIVVQYANENAYFPPAPFKGQLAAQAWKTAADADQPSQARVAVAPSVDPYGSTGFVVADRGGMSVSCVLSMGKMFGSGKTLGLSSMIGYEPHGDDMDVNSMMPMLVGNRHVKDLRLAAAGSGPTAIADVLEFSLKAYAQRAAAQLAVAEVARKGDTLSRVTGLSCPDGAPHVLQTCSLPSDPRGAGVTRTVGLDFKKGSFNLNVPQK